MGYLKQYKKEANMGREIPPKPPLLVEVEEETATSPENFMFVSHYKPDMKKVLGNITSLVIKNITTDKETATNFLNILNSEASLGDNYFRSYYVYKPIIDTDIIPETSFSIFVMFYESFKEILTIYTLERNWRNLTEYDIIINTYKKKDIINLNFTKNANSDKGKENLLKMDEFNFPRTNFETTSQLYLNIKKLL